jgi:hypothetical protein
MRVDRPTLFRRAKGMWAAELPEEWKKDISYQYLSMVEQQWIVWMQ